MKTVNALYQHGTMALLVPGLLKGTITVDQLLAHGDTGIGSGEGLDGELIILEGVAYSVKANGDIVKVSMNYPIPFANVHFANFSLLKVYRALSKSELSHAILDSGPIANLFFAIKIKGRFSKVQVRTGNKFNEPYPTLIQAAEAQIERTKENAIGFLVGYYAPKLFHGCCVSGFHMHFLSKDHQFGGHIIDYHLDEGEVYIQIFDTLIQHFPTDYPAFIQHDFSKDNLAQAITKAEG